MKHWLLLLTLSCMSVLAMATHNRAGEIIYRHLGGPSPTYEITIITYTESASLADRDSLTLEVYYLGQTNAISTIEVGRDQITVFGSNLGIQENRYIVESYTFPGPGQYKIAMTDPNRIDGIINIAQSVNEAFYIEDTLFIRDPQFYAFNNSPVLLESPIVFTPRFAQFRYNPAAYDPDGDSLVFALVDPKQNQLNSVSGYRYPDHPAFGTPGFPNSFTIDSVTGDILWDVPTVLGIYNIAILVREFRDGIFLGSLVRDMQIIVVNNQFNPPVVQVPEDTCILVGDRLTALIRGSDPDNFQTLTLTANGGPFFVDNSPATFVSNPAKGNVTGFFDWRTNCSHISPVPYTVVFKVQDDFVNAAGASQPYSDIRSWRIRVVAPPVNNLTATALPDGIDLNWEEPYSCADVDTFLGFSIWRKRGCDSTLLDPCFTGSLTAYGYQRIAGPLKSYSYLDTTINKGVVYAYRIVPEFAKPIPGSSQFTFNAVSGLPSDQVCAVVNADVPLFTQVDVAATDANAGVILLAWVAPNADVLDTLLNPGPYKVELYRHTGFQAILNPILLQSYTYPQFAQFTRESFTDTGLNTVDGPYNYGLTFYGTRNGQYYEIGKATNASSIYLNTAAGGNRLELQWEEDVPWINYQYQVLREQAGTPGTFDTLAMVTTNRFIDTGLVNGETYCYYIRAFGSYFNPFTPDTLINRSQIKCDVPQDTIPPCVPALTVENDCADILSGSFPEVLTNSLIWSSPVTRCQEDALVAYRIYYSPSANEPLAMLREITDISDTVFFHTDLVNLAGCYAVTAIDSFGNESDTSNRVCVDNCPYYVLPSAFSPNNDGDNDLYTPRFPYFFVDRVEMSIFNRWGNLVFQTEDPMINWDGTDQVTGGVLAEGVYYYTCRVFQVQVGGIQELAEPLNGYIHLIRSE